MVIMHLSTQVSLETYCVFLSLKALRILIQSHRISETGTLRKDSHLSLLCKSICTHVYINRFMNITTDPIPPYVWEIPPACREKD